MLTNVDTRDHCREERWVDDVGGDLVICFFSVLCMIMMQKRVWVVEMASIEGMDFSR